MFSWYHYNVSLAPLETFVSADGKTSCIEALVVFPLKAPWEIEDSKYCRYGHCYRTVCCGFMSVRT